MLRKGKSISLTPSELDVLLYLAQAAGRAVGREELAERALRGKELLSTNVIDVHVRNLRKKLDRPHAQTIIETIHGTGYAIAV